MDEKKFQHYLNGLYNMDVYLTTLSDEERAMYLLKMANALDIVATKHKLKRILGKIRYSELTNSEKDYFNRLINKYTKKGKVYDTFADVVESGETDAMFRRWY